MYIIDGIAYDDSRRNELVISKDCFPQKFKNLYISNYNKVFWELPNFLENFIIDKLYYLINTESIDPRSLSEILEDSDFESMVILQTDSFRNESIIMSRNILSKNSEFEKGVVKFSRTEFLKDDSLRTFDFIKSNPAVPIMPNVENHFILTTSVIPIQELLDKDSFKYYILRLSNIKELKSSIDKNMKMLGYY